jgi:hypothetical protein
MSDFFRAYQATQSRVPTYFLESTAPNNVDDTVASNASGIPGVLQLIDDPQQAIDQIAAHLAKAREPNLVVMVHGFNNPRPAVLGTYAVAADTIEGDAAIRSRKGVVCVGYRWPSEKMGQPIRGTWRALPLLAIWILLLSFATLAVATLFYWVLDPKLYSPYLPHFIVGYVRNLKSFHAVALTSLAVAGLVLTAILLRIIVYFRDVYRATNYGVPDLIQIIRSIDSAIVKRRGRRGRRVQLSLIGHSMGGFVVTNVIRVLSDVFAGATAPLNAYGARGLSKKKKTKPDKNYSEIGNVFVLKRFVLASPDIPAEARLSSRGNFLASSLMRFEEAYLFSNEGDEVLRQISTFANFFMFPTKSRAHGYRLGNVEVLSKKMGIVPVADANFLKALRIGRLTLQELYDRLQKTANMRQAAAVQLAGSATTPIVKNLPKAPLPRIFSYFDCTDYDEIVDFQKRGLLTFAKCQKRRKPNARLRWYSHLRLLFAYIVRQKPNVHGGYFEGELSRQLIYRLACLGYDDTVAAFGGRQALSDACEEKQIRVLLSPNL